MNKYEFLQSQIAKDAAKDWMHQVIKVHEQAVRDLHYQLDRFEEACLEKEGSSTTPVEALSHFVNTATKVVPMNIRLDLAANHGAALALTSEKLRQAKGGKK